MAGLPDVSNILLQAKETGFIQKISFYK